MRFSRPFNVLKTVRRSAAVAALLVGFAAAQHPAFAPPDGFVVDGVAAPGARTFVQTRSNGDRLRVFVTTAEGATDMDAAAKTLGAETSDTTLDATRQEITIGDLSGVAFSCLGATERVDGLPYSRYRRVFGFNLKGAAPFVVRADVLAKEPKPSGTTLEAMARALADWQRAVGGASTPPPDPESTDPASKPSLGGTATISVTGGGDAELRVPAAWGRADVDFGDGRTAIFTGPAREVLEKLTKDTLAVDLDRLGPYVRFERIRKAVFDDLVDQRILDIADSLLDDYVVSQEEAGITLTLGERDEGTLGTRVVVSVPFEEVRKSGTKHKGRLVAMLHRGVLVLVTASHPTEAYDQGWPAVAAALDTLVFTGLPEPDPAVAETRTTPAADAPGEAPATPEAPAAPSAPDTPASAGPRVAAGPLKLPEAKPDAVDASKIDGAVVVRLAAPLPIAFAHPKGFALFGAAPPEAESWAFVAVPDPARASDATRSRVRLEYRSFREELAVPGVAGRLEFLLVGKLKRDAAEQGLGIAVRAVGERRFGDAEGAVVDYDVLAATGETRASGKLAGAALDGTSLLFDVRAAAGDSEVAARVDAILGAFEVRSDVSWTRRSAGRLSLESPASWSFEESENRAQGRDVFIRSPAGVDVRVQSAKQSRGDLVTSDVLRRVAHGFLVEGLRVLTAREFQDAKRYEAPGAPIGLRFASAGPSLDALVLSGVVGDQLVFSMRAAPVGFRGRDLAVAWRVVNSVFDAGRAALPAPALSGNAFAERVVFTRTEFDDISAEGAARPPSTFYVAFLPDGTAGVLLIDGSAKRDLRATYVVSGAFVDLDCAGLGGVRRYQLSDGGEALYTESGEALFRARREETP